MAYYDNELNIINDFMDIFPGEILIFDEVGEKILNDIYNFNNWKNSSGKSDPPPDMYSTEYELMMDIMRVDDHTTINKKGIIYNPYRTKENKTYREIQKWVKNNNINLKGDIFINTITDLPTDEDHNYEKYLNEFIRVIKKHDASYELYIKNHPTKKLIYFILDESSPYFRSDEKNIVIKAGNSICAQLHLFFYDENFIDVLKKSKADYIIWYAPFKRFDSLEKVELPKAIVFSKENLKQIRTINYTINEMYSIEE